MFIKGADLASSAFISANDSGRVNLNDLAGAPGANFDVSSGAKNPFVSIGTASNFYNLASDYGKQFAGSSKLFVTDAGTANGSPAGGHQTHNGGALDLRYQNIMGQNIQDPKAVFQADFTRTRYLADRSRNYGFTYNLTPFPNFFNTNAASQKAYNLHFSHIHMGRHTYEELP